MDDNKDNKNEQKQEDADTVFDNEPNESGETDAHQDENNGADELDNELTRLTTLFKDELQKATLDNEKDDKELDLINEIQELEDVKEEIEAEAIPLDM